MTRNPRKSSWRLLAVVLLATQGCGGSSGGGGIASDSEIVALCDRLIARVEAASSSEQLQGLEALALFVDNYAYPPARAPRDLPPPGEIVPYQLEPADSRELYQMAGVLALANGNRSAALWASARALRQSPAHGGLLAQVGTILVDEENCADAELVLRKAKHVDGKNELTRLTLAAAHVCRRNVNAAVAEVREAAGIAPDHRIVRETLMELYELQMPELKTQRQSYLGFCASDIVQGVELASTEQLSAFIAAKRDEANALTMEMLNHVTAIPPNLPMEIIVDLNEAHDAMLQRDETSCAAPLEGKVSELHDLLSDKEEELATDLSDCCAAAGQPCCSCFYGYCDGIAQFQENVVIPAGTKAMEAYLPCGIGTLKSGEQSMLAAVLRHGSKLSSSDAAWALRYVYLLLGGHCKYIALSAAYAGEIPLLTQDRVQGCTDTVQEVCVTAQLEAFQEELRRRMQEAREAAAEAARIAAEAEQYARDGGIRGELCLDSLGCLGVDGAKLSVKVGGGVFAQFSVDFDKLSVGARLGVGISDPTGNLAGADLSFGGEIGPGTRSFDVSYSQSFAAGTIKQEVALFKRTF